MPDPSAPLLEVRGLSVHYRTDGESPVSAVDALSFGVAPGEALGVLGESGCGKTSLGLSILGLLPPAGSIAGGSIRFRGEELAGLEERRLEKMRGVEIGLIFQEPTLALHPTRRVGSQIVEVIRAHRPWGQRRCREQAQAWLAEVGFAAGDRIGHAYPHQLSGGQRQRIVIAQALACRPSLVIADEPTASLDSTTQAQILALLRKLKERFRMAFLYISHDPQVLAEIADRLLVMYSGRRVEEGPLERVFRDPLHPYTEGLLRCMPPLVASPGGGQMGGSSAAAGRRELPAIPGSGPVVRGLVPGCRFAPRCPYKMPRCTAHDPVRLRPRTAHSVWCFRHDECGAD
ncbi:MAG: ABC transporter ATP-binding protein [bacterium]|nr:ABC transporter ATP-binding protein [bacterium]